MGYYVEYATVGCLPDTTEQYDTLKDAKQGLRDMVANYQWDNDNRVKIINALVDITKKELMNGYGIVYATVRDISEITIRYITTRKYELILCSADSINGENMSYANTLHDSETLEEIQSLMNDYDITACIFDASNGDYDNLYVGYGYPSFRKREIWWKVEWLS